MCIHIYLYCPNLVQWSRFHTSKAVLLAQPFIKVWTYFSNRRLAFAVWLVWEDKCKHAGAFYFLVHNHHGMSMILRLFLLPSRSLVQWTWEVCQFENYVFRSIRPGSIDVLHMRQTGWKFRFNTSHAKYVVWPGLGCSPGSDISDSGGY